MDTPDQPPDPFAGEPVATAAETEYVHAAADRMRRAAAKLRELASAASEAPWFYDGYCRVGSAPRVPDEDVWLDPLVDAGHTIERYGQCEACGDWREQPSGRSPGLGDGCQHFAEFYHRVTSSVAAVPAEAGDTAYGVHAANAKLIAALRNLALPLAAWLDESAAEGEQVGPDRFALALAVALLGSVTDPADPP